MIGISVQSLVIQAPQVGFRMKKEVSQYYRSKSLYRGGELIVRIVRCDKFLYLRRQSWINAFATIFLGLQLSPQRSYRCCALIRLAERYVECGNPCAIFSKRVQHLCKVGPGEGPFAEHLLGMLIDVHDRDSRIYGCDVSRTVAEARVERSEFEALYKIEDWSGALAKESEVIKRERAECDDKTNDERDAVAPPGLQNFVEAEEAPPLPKTL